MFRDLKEYQEIQKIYEESIVQIPHEDLIIEALQEEGFTEEEFDFLVENIDEILSEQILLTEGQDDLHERLGGIARVLGKAVPKIAQGAGKVVQTASKTPIGQKVTQVGQAIGKRVAQDSQKVTGALKNLSGKVGGSGAAATGATKGGAIVPFKKNSLALTKASAGQKLTNVANKVKSKVANVANQGKKVVSNVVDKGKQVVKKVGDSNLGKKVLNVAKKVVPLAGAVAGGVALGNRLKTKADTDKADTEVKTDTKGGDKKTTPSGGGEKKMSQIEKDNRQRFGNKRVDFLKAKNADFKAYKKGEMSKADFIKKYPKSQTAKNEYIRKNPNSSQAMQNMSYEPVGTPIQETFGYDHKTANNLAEIYKKMYDTPSEESEKKNLDEVSKLGKGYIAKKVIGTTFNKAISNPKNLNTVRAVGLTAAGTAAYAPIVGTMVAPETTQKVMQKAVDRIKEFSKPQLDVNRGGKKKEEKKDEKEIKMEAYDVVLEYLLSTQQAATIEEANYIMTEMDAKTIQDIVSQQLNEQN